MAAATASVSPCCAAAVISCRSPYGAPLTSAKRSGTIHCSSTSQEPRLTPCHRGSRVDYLRQRGLVVSPAGPREPDSNEPASANSPPRYMPKRRSPADGRPRQPLPVPAGVGGWREAGSEADERQQALRWFALL